MSRLRPIDVELTETEVEIAIHVGKKRQSEAERQELEDRYGFDGENGEEIHIEGVAGEIAFARAFGIYAEFSVNRFEAPDIGTKYQVKTRSKLRYGLLVRPNDKEHLIYVLVLGTMPKLAVWGWMLGKDAKRATFLETYGGRPPAFFVPKDELNDLSTLDVQPVRMPQRPAEAPAPPDWDL